MRSYNVRRAVVVGMLAVATFISAGGDAARAQAIHERRVVRGLDWPVAFTFTNSGQIVYVERNTGNVRIYNLRTDADRRLFDIDGVSSSGERGTLGVALHPDYPSRPFVYVYVTRSVAGRLRNQILRLSDAAGDRRQKVVFSSPASSNPYHNGGRILFGPDGMLYAIVGDGHTAANAQDLTNNDRGKILRMTPRGGVPSDNPLRGRIFAYGIRNSFGFAFDPVRDRLWETDNGPECNDEINLIRPGRNYGWGPRADCSSGSSPRNTNNSGPSPRIQPEFWFTDSIGITGIAFCRGCALNGRSEGTLFFGDVTRGIVRRAKLNQARDEIVDVQRMFTVPSGMVLSMEVAPDGRIYFSDSNSIYRLVFRR